MWFCNSSRFNYVGSTLRIMSTFCEQRLFDMGDCMWTKFECVKFLDMQPQFSYFLIHTLWLPINKLAIELTLSWPRDLKNTCLPCGESGGATRRPWYVYPITIRIHTPLMKIWTRPWTELIMIIIMTVCITLVIWNKPFSHPVYIR